MENRPLYQIILEDFHLLKQKMIMDGHEFYKYSFLDDFLDAVSHFKISPTDHDVVEINDVMMVWYIRAYINLTEVESEYVSMTQYFDKYLNLYNERCELNAYNISMTDYLGSTVQASP